MTSIQERFGANANVDLNDPNDPILQIKYSDLAGAGWDNLQAGDEQNPEKWLSAFIVLNQQLENTLTTEEHNLTVTPPLTPTIQQRNGQLVRGYSYTITIFVPDNSSLTPDPDEV